MAGNAFVRVHDWEVQSFMLPGQPVDKLVHDTAILTKYFAQGHINNRTGLLGRMIQANRPSRSGAFKNSATVFTRTSYALYVHEGTDAIFPTHGKYLTVPKENQGGPLNLSGGTLRKMWRRSGGRQEYGGVRPYFTARHISGQRANPFLSKGLHEAMGTIR